MSDVPRRVGVRLRRAGAGPDDALVDSFGRVHRDLRISVTDRCNLRCVHCMPEEGVEFQPREELLSYEEIARVASVTRRLGVRTVRLTGGEPLVRKGVPTLVRLLVAEGFEDVALTTNGTELPRRARELADAGLTRVNVSCDSLDAQRFAEIRRGGTLAAALEGMAAAEAVGLGPVKVNVVLLRGVNDDEVEGFAEFARSTGRQVRFIEFMPLDGAEQWTAAAVVPSDEVISRISARWPLRPLDARGAAPAQSYAFVDGRGEIGVIPTVTRPFCGDCDRLRLTADGHLRSCLFATEEVPLRELLRGGAGDEDIADALRATVAAKRAGRGSDDLTLVRHQRSMSMIGG